MNWDTIVGFINIVIIDLALSGDNAIVIGMAAASLPRQQRTKAIVFGGICAIALRIALTAVATTLMKFTLLSAIAGAVLFWVAWKLLRMDSAESVESESEGNKSKEAKNFRQAIILILTADFMLSLDNVLAVAGAAHQNYSLLIIGLLISMPLLMTTGGFISRMIDKFKWLPILGAAVICFTATRMILEDKFIEPKIGISTTLITIISVIAAIVVTAGIMLFNKMRANKKNKEPRLTQPENDTEKKD
jgi:YjbE family integral membrane protein